MQAVSSAILFTKPIKAVQADVAGADAGGSIFFIREVFQPCFSREFHFHEECQLAYIVHGAGRRIVGDSVERFAAGELVLIGSNVPHVWLDDENDNPAVKKQHLSISLFISPQKFRDHFSAFGDVKYTDQLFEKAHRGLVITGKAKTELIALLKTANIQNGIEQVITLLKLISTLGATNEYRQLASPNYSNSIPYKDSERMNRVYNYIFENYNKDIQFQQVAAVAGMNPNAFCRFFKSKTQKSLTAFLNEIRIGHACKLLTQKEDPISKIAYDCGFNNVSNFNHFFKLLKKIPPRQFRKEILGLKINRHA